jgi:hypothetical protein
LTAELLDRAAGDRPDPAEHLARAASLESLEDSPRAERDLLDHVLHLDVAQDALPAREPAYEGDEPAVLRRYDGNE